MSRGTATNQAPTIVPAVETDRSLVFAVSVDDVHAINEEHGHVVGTKVLKTFHALLKKLFPAGRVESIVGAQTNLSMPGWSPPANGLDGENSGARVDGDTSPDKCVDDVVSKLTRLQEVLSTKGIGVVGDSLVDLTFSAGIADLPSSRSKDPIRLATEALTAAKQGGGARILRASEVERSRGTVLLVEDDDISALLIRHVLEGEGFLVEHVDNGRTAVERARASEPCLFVLDVNLPFLGGFEIAETIREMPRHRRTPLIFVTSMNSSSDLLQGFRMGASDYITKPFAPDELRARVDRWVPRRGAPKAEDGDFARASSGHSDEEAM